MNAVDLIRDTHLTENEGELVALIVKEQLSEDTGGWGPTLDECCAYLGESANTVRGYLGSLIKKEVVYIEGGEGDVPEVYQLTCFIHYDETPLDEQEQLFELVGLNG